MSFKFEIGQSVSIVDHSWETPRVLDSGVIENRKSETRKLEPSAMRKGNVTRREVRIYLVNGKTVSESNLVLNK